MNFEALKSKIDIACNEFDSILDNYRINRTKKNVLTGGGAIWGTDSINKLSSIIEEITNEFGDNTPSKLLQTEIEAINDYLVIQSCERILIYIEDLNVIERLYKMNIGQYLFETQGIILKLKQLQLATNSSEYLVLFHNQILNELKKREIDTVNSLIEFEKLMNEKNKSGCYVATMAYGDYDHPQVLELRRFRDEVLLKSKLGTYCVDFYYWISPKMVEIFKDKKNINSTIRVILNLIVKIIKK